MQGLGGIPVLHVDVCHIHAYFMQVQGTKRIAFFLPGDSPCLYLLAPSFTISGLPGDLNDVDLAEFLRFGSARYGSIDLELG